MSTDSHEHLPTLKRLRDFDALGRLRSNAPSTPAEREQVARFGLDVRGDVVKYEEEVARQEKEVAKIRSQLLQLKHQKQQLEAHLTLCGRLNSPIRRIPTEVLSMIFSHLSDNDLWEWNDLSKEDSDTNLPSVWHIQGQILSQVCCRWRAVANSTPALWSKFSLSITADKSFKPFEIVMALVIPVLLERSKSHPLDLRVKLVHENSPTQSVWSLLLANRSRWRTFKLESEEDYPIEKRPFEGIQPLQLPLLENFGTDAAYECFGFLNDTPKLTSLSCSGNNLFLLKDPAAQISEIAFAEWQSDDLAKTLEHFEQATQVTYIMLRPQPDFEAEFEVPPRCTSLALDFSERLGEAIYLPRVIFSVTLQELKLIGGWSESRLHMSPEYFQSLLAHSRCALTSLFLDGSFMSADALLAGFALLPTLTNISINEFYWEPHSRNYQWKGESSLPSPLVSPYALRRLQDKGASGFGFILLPRLEHLQLKIRCHSVPDEIICDIAVARVLEGLRLFKLHMKDRPLKPKQFSGLLGFVGRHFRAEITGTKTPWWEPGEDAKEYAEMW